ncbi:hypothetical protein Tco_1115358 [Tanacetum coccineum]
MQALLSFLIAGFQHDVEESYNHPHCEAIKAQQNQNPASGQTSMARDGSVFRYDPDYLREQFTGLVIQRALPFNHFDHEQTTRVFQNNMQPRYIHVSRYTLKRDAMKLWLAAKQEIIDSFGNINSRVNLTTDVWSAPHGVLGFYMCVTSHWIEHDTCSVGHRDSLGAWGGDVWLGEVSSSNPTGTFTPSGGIGGSTGGFTIQHTAQLDVTAGPEPLITNKPF